MEQIICFKIEGYEPYNWQLCGSEPSLTEQSGIGCLPMSKSPFMEALRQHMLYYIRYSGMRHPAELNRDHVMTFLTFLADQREVSVATQKLPACWVACVAVRPCWLRCCMDRACGDRKHCDGTMWMNPQSISCSKRRRGRCQESPQLPGSETHLTSSHDR